MRPTSIFLGFIGIATLPAASAQTGLNSLPDVEFAQLSQRDPNPLGERALSINPRGGNMARPSITFIILLTVRWRPRSQWRVGVALHSGAVACSNVGVDAQRDATIIGDAVNTVFRLKSLMKRA